MEEIGKIFAFAMPVFVVIVLSEKLYGRLKGNDTVPWMDAIASSYSGMSLAIRALFGVAFQLFPTSLCTTIWRLCISKLRG
jgi:hypothetical protein